MIDESLRGSSGTHPTILGSNCSAPEASEMESTLNPYALPTASSDAKPIPALHALTSGAQLLPLTAELALPATPQQPSAPLPIAMATGGHNAGRHHPEEAASIEEWPRQIQDEIGMESVLIPAGSFLTGGSGLSSDPSENPRHEVTITRPFYIGKYEVTLGEWQAVMGSNPSHPVQCGERCSLDTVSWFDAQAFADRLNEIEGPTATGCQPRRNGGMQHGPDRTGPGTAPSTRSRGIGETTRTGRIRWAGSSRTRSVCTIRSTLGKAAKWVHDWFGPYRRNPQMDPAGPASGCQSAVRGYCGLGQNVRGHGSRAGFLGFFTLHGGNAQDAGEAAVGTVLGDRSSTWTPRRSPVTLGKETT